jgi:hypothetical protein
MSSSGTTPSNTGPLIIRTYNNASSNNNTYVLSDYDIPVASNLVLITSTNGRIIPSSAPHISTATFSSIQISSLFDSDGLLGTTGEVLHTDGSQIYWGPSGAGSGYWSEDGTKIFNNNDGGAGFVGINTINPSSNLHVNGSFQVITDNELQPFLSNTTQNYLFVKPGNNGFVNLGAFNTGTGSKPLVLQLESGGAAGGNVGINISSPQFMLDVAGSIRASTFLSTNFINMNNGKVTTDKFLISSTNPTDNTGTFKVELSGANFLVYKSTLGASQPATVVANSGSGALALGTTDPRLFLTGTNVGINTSTPQCMLDIQGSALTKQILTSSLTTNIGASGNWSNYYGKYVFVSTTNTLTLPTTGVSEGSVLIFRNLDLTSSLTINNCFTGGSPIPSNGAASFIFTTLYGGSTWISM